MSHSCVYDVVVKYDQQRRPVATTVRIVSSHCMSMVKCLVRERRTVMGLWNRSS